jgi:hypothetical protein
MVFDEHDRPGNTRFALELSNPPAGLLTVDVTPGNHKTYELAKDVLKGFGKRVDITGAAQTNHETWFQACAWIVGERVREIFVCRAHLVDGYRWRRLIELASLADARLWLIVHLPRLSRGQKETARDWDLATIGFAGFRRRWRQTIETHPPQTQRQDPLPAVPDEEFPTFLSSCQKHLAAGSFQLVAEVYWRAHRQTLEWFEEQAGEARGLETGAVAEFLHALLAPSAGLTERLVCARAAQAAAFLHRWLLKLDARALAGAYFASPLSSLDESTMNTLRLYSHPRYAAAALVSLASGEPPSAISALDIDDIQDDGGAIEIEGRRVEIPRGGRGIIRAFLAFRLSEGATSKDPVFVSEKRSAAGRNGREFGRTTAHGLRGRLTRVSLDTGLLLVAAETPGERDPARWLRRQGLTVKRLARVSDRT